MNTLLRSLLLLVTISPALRAAPDAEVIRKTLQPFVDNHTIAGAVGLVHTEGQGTAVVAVGMADLASARAQKEDDLFWIASMTKPISAVAVLMMQDEGKLSIEDPVAKHLPEFRESWVKEESPADTLRLRKAARPITLRDLLTHTSGLGGEPPDLGQPLTLAELTLFYSQQPLVFEPGLKWSYNNPGINTLGRIVEVVSGKPYAEFLQDRIFHPLGMNDTTFWPDESQARRLSTSYKPNAEGKLEPVAISFLKGGISDRTRTPRPSGGLFSTAKDMLRFYQMMLAGGTFEGRTYLSLTALRAMTTTQTGDLKTGFTDGMSWGLGFQVVKEPQGVTGPLAVGTFGHGGAHGTQSWADPATRTVYVLMIQRAGFPNGDDSDVRKAFHAATAPAGK
jgi:CubicO group peptidase (beta-lactamase class C family)